MYILYKYIHCTLKCIKQFRATKADQCLPGDRTGKVRKEKKGYQEYMETFRGNGYAHYLDDDDGLTIKTYTL